MCTYGIVYLYGHVIRVRDTDSAAARTPSTRAGLRETGVYYK